MGKRDLVHNRRLPPARDFRARLVSAFHHSGH
jgi:hypothetical protein